jgi:spore coat polysaccharide biosynthesis predicted glycosyltransferase SpsG
MLNTEASYIKGLKELGAKVINFEDQGNGAKEADLVVNAVYPEQFVRENHYCGPDYFLLRDEFLLTEPKEVSKEVQTVLLTFGGVDPNNFTKKVLDAIGSYCREKGILIEVVAGFGYQHYDSITESPGVKIFRNSTSISDHMRNADIVFASAGRTTYELASLHVPTIVLSQNERETLHFFASPINGFLNLGLGACLDEQTLLSTFVELAESYETRVRMSSIMKKLDLRSGRRRVVDLVNSLIRSV